jgi:hypothetical protein
MQHFENSRGAQTCTWYDEILRNTLWTQTGKNVIYSVHGLWGQGPDTASGVAM